MGIKRIVAYFDYLGFNATFATLAPQLERYDWSGLRSMAHEMGSGTPALWKVIDFKYTPDDLGNEEREFDTLESRLRFWIMVIVGSFAENVFVSPQQARVTLDALTIYGVPADAIAELWIGRPLDSLALPAIEDRSALQGEDREWPYWCRNLGIGWLNRDDITWLLTVLIQNDRYVSEQAAGLCDTEAHRAYESVVALLKVALERDQGLLVGVDV